MAKQTGAIRFTGKFANAVGFKNTSGKSANNNFMRERVYEISNPQTYAQSAQRAKVRPAQLFYSAFESIENHAFIPLGKASKNRNRFMSLAMRADTPDVPKGQSFLPVVDYVIAEGSLGLDRYTKGETRDDGVHFPIAVPNQAGATNVALLSAAILDNNVGFVEGEEITFMAILCPQGQPTERFAVHFSVVLDRGNTVTEIADIIPSSIEFINGANEYAFNAIAGYVIMSAGLIISSKTPSSWIYTNSRMLVTLEGRMLLNSQLEVIQSYMAGASSRESDLILQQATNANSTGVVPVSIEDFDGVGSYPTLVKYTDGSNRVLVLPSGNLAAYVDANTVADSGVALAGSEYANEPTIGLASVQRYLNVATPARAIQKVTYNVQDTEIPVGGTIEDAGLVKITPYAAGMVGLISATLDGNAFQLPAIADGVITIDNNDGAVNGTLVISDNAGVYCTVTLSSRP